MSVMDKWSDENGVLRHEEMTKERARALQLAQHLSSMALRQWEKALTGVVALPAATSLLVAAIATYGGVAIGRGFEVFESAVGAVGRSVASVAAEKRDGNGERRPGPDRSASLTGS
jgi:hypothetical protein